MSEDKSDDQNVSAIRNFVESTQAKLRSAKKMTPKKELRVSIKQLPEEPSGKRKLSEITNKTSDDDDSSIASKDEDALTIAEFVKKKRKKMPPITMDDVPSDLQEIIKMSGLDEMLEEKAKKTRLTATHVKNIIKQVIANPDISSFLKNISDDKEQENSTIFEPKCTRAKAKELMEQRIKETGEVVQGQMLISDFDLTYPEVQALATEEFPDEDDGEDYDPDADVEGDKSEDEVTIGTVSVPVTPSAPAQSVAPTTPSTSGFSGCRRSPRPLPSNLMSEPLGKIVQRNLDFTKPPDRTQELICTRTRSKYPMTDTPVEYIEMNFKPPDVTHDMYSAADFDDDYAEFLREYAMPPDVITSAEYDENSDPDFNVMGHCRITKKDIKEEIRNDKGVNVSMKEYSEMITDLQCDLYDLNDNSSSRSSQIKFNEPALGNDFSFSNMHFSCETPRCDSVNSSIYRVNCDTPLRQNQAKENFVEQNFDFFVEPPPPPTDTAMVNCAEMPPAAPILVSFMIPRMSPQQLKVLRIQMMQHIQLLTSSILLCHKVPERQLMAHTFRKFINEICTNANESGNISESIYNPWNLRASIDTLAAYDNNQHLDAHIPDRVIAHKHSFTKLLKCVFLNSCAFPFIRLLPQSKYCTPRSISKSNRKIVQDSQFITSEDWLLAQALREYLSMDKYKQLIGGTRLWAGQLKEIAIKIENEGILIKTHKAIFERITYIRRQFKFEGNKEDNPILKIVAFGTYDEQALVPKIPTFTPRPLKDYPETCNLPPFWIKYKAEYWAQNHKITIDDDNTTIDDVVDDTPLYMIVYPNTNTASMTAADTNLNPSQSATLQSTNNMESTVNTFPEAGFVSIDPHVLPLCAVSTVESYIDTDCAVQTITASAVSEPQVVDRAQIMAQVCDIDDNPRVAESYAIQYPQENTPLSCVPPSPSISISSVMDMPMWTASEGITQSDNNRANRTEQSNGNLSLGSIVASLHLNDMPYLMATPLKTPIYGAAQSIETPFIEGSEFAVNTPVRNLDETCAPAAQQCMATPTTEAGVRSRRSPKVSSVLKNSKDNCTTKSPHRMILRSTTKQSESDYQISTVPISTCDEKVADDPDSADEALSEVDVMKHEINFEDDDVSTDLDACQATPRNSASGELVSATNTPRPLTESNGLQENQGDFSLNFLKRAKRTLLPESSSVFNQLICTLKKYQSRPDAPEKLYLKVEKIFKDFPVLAKEFLLFLKPHQAIKISKFYEYCSAVHVNKFEQKLKIHSVSEEQIQKLINIINMALMENLSDKGVEKMKSKIAPMLQCPQLIQSFDECFSPPAHISKLEETARKMAESPCKTIGYSMSQASPLCMCQIASLSNSKTVQNSQAGKENVSRVLAEKKISTNNKETL